ncbi:protein Star [Aethina tumida]|uniref:protein Star n=1 Tax=Aethina tumida TaxID=116153 RepID=UPI00096B0CEE|nr:protein Star [Aethina tumida]
MSANNQNNAVQSNVSEIPPSPTKVGAFDPNVSVTNKLLPLAAFFIAFVTVMTILIVYMDHTAMKHYQFQVNMSQDNEFYGVAQDNPQLITYIREVHLTPAIEPHHKMLESEDTISNDTIYVLKLLNNKRNGVFVEAGAYGDGKTSKTDWLERKLNWRGLLIQSDPRHYFSLRRHNRVRSQAIHACLSPIPYPKEVTLHQEHDGVKINSIHANSIEDTDSFNTRVKCFPIYSLLLAMNVMDIDYLSLEAGGTELQVLETIPFDKVNIKIISVTLTANDLEKETIKKFLAKMNYTFMQSFNTTYIFKMN